MQSDECDHRSVQFRCVHVKFVSLWQDSRLLPLQLWLQPPEYYQHTSTGHLLPRRQEGKTSS